MDTEVLETNEIIVPNELLEYLKEDEKALEKYNNKIQDIISKEKDLAKEVEDKSKEYEDRLEEFKKSLEQEKEEQAKIFNDRADKLKEEKNKIESIKSEQETKKQSYISSLININDTYSSKINSIKGAIDIAPDNDSLKKALEEEEEKLKNDLLKESDNRRTEINNALSTIDEREELIEEPKVEENETDINIDIPEVTPVTDIIAESYDNNEVISHEPREDVINEIYGSEEVMEGHVFPYLNGLLGE